MKRKLKQMNFNFLVFSILKGCFDTNEQMNILRAVVGHGTLPSACIYPPMSPAVEGWPQMSGNGVFPYYYPPQPKFPTTDESLRPPMVPAEVWAHVNPLNHHLV